MDEQISRVATVRVAGTWFIVAGLLTGLVAASDPHMGYLFVAGLLVLIGVGLRIEAALRDVDGATPRLTSPGTDAK